VDFFLSAYARFDRVSRNASLERQCLRSGWIVGRVQYLKLQGSSPWRQVRHIICDRTPEYGALGFFLLIRPYWPGGLDSSFHRCLGWTCFNISVCWRHVSRVVVGGCQALILESHMEFLWCQASTAQQLMFFFVGWALVVIEIRPVCGSIY